MMDYNSDILYSTKSLPYPKPVPRTWDRREGLGKGLVDVLLRAHLPTDGRLAARDSTDH